MNKQQLFTAGSVLLATTALTGAANAGIISAPVSVGGAFGGTAVVAKKVANTLFSTTAATANAVTVGMTSITVAFSNNFTSATKFSIELDPIGATFVQSVDANVILGSAGSFNSFLLTAPANCTTITPLTTKIILDNCNVGTATSATNGAGTNVSASYAGVLFSGVSFNNAAGLATVGGSIGVNGLVYNGANPSQNFETITAGTLITSVSPLSASITPGATAVANASATPVAFAYFSTGADISATNLATTLTYVDISSTGALAADLTTVLVPESTVAGVATAFISSIAVTVTSSALSQAGAISVSASTVTNATIANFSAGVATFSINAGTGFTSFAISVAFSGTAAISAASAGTVSIGFGITTAGQQAPAAVSGKTGSISLGGFSAELNTFLGSSNASFSSFARIHNNGVVAAPAFVTVRNDATGATMGTYTTASIATGQTLQISAKDIETGAGITAAAGLNYTLSIAGAFSGYAQHIIFNPATGQLADLSSFRNKGNAGVTAP